MPSDVDAFMSGTAKAIQELSDLKKTKKELESSLRALRALRDDVKGKTLTEGRRGRKIRREVENWLYDVEDIEEEARKNEQAIKLLCEPANILRNVEASLSKPSSSIQNDTGDTTVIGMGGPRANISFGERSVVTTTYGQVATTHHHYYDGKGPKSHRVADDEELERGEGEANDDD